MIKKCLLCVHFCPCLDVNVIGECRKNPPLLITGSDKPGIPTLFPRVKVDEWCSCFKSAGLTVDERHWVWVKFKRCFPTGTIKPEEWTNSYTFNTEAEAVAFKLGLQERMLATDVIVTLGKGDVPQ